MEYVKKDREEWKKELAEQIKSVEDLKKFPNLNLDLAPWSIVVEKILIDTKRTDNPNFKEWLLSKESLGYLFSSSLYLMAYKCYRRLCKNNDVVVVITGREGVGKSTLAMKFAMLVSPTFSLKNICFNRGQFFNGLDQCSKKDSFLLDEGNLIIFGRDYASKGSKNTIKLFSTMRQKNVMTIIAVPSFQTLDTYIRKHRVHFMFRVVRRGGGLFIVDSPRLAFNVVTNPVVAGKKVVEVVKDPFKVGYSFGDALRSNPITTGGKVVFDVGVYPGLVSKFASGVRNVGVRAVATERPASNIFDPDVLKKVEAGETAFPTANVEESVRLFKKARDEKGLVVVSASPTPITTGGQSRVVVVGEGSSSDVGLFTTPMGSGSPYFLKVGKYEPITEPPSFSLFPSVDRPTASVVRGVSDVVRIPFEKLKAGVEASREFIRSKKGSGEVVITRGSEAGSNPSLRFDPVSKKSTFATTEIEANIPPGSVLQTTGDRNLLLGFSEYVVVGGKPVPIREYEITKLGVDIGKNVADDIIASRSYGGRGGRVSPSYLYSATYPSVKVSENVGSPSSVSSYSDSSIPSSSFSYSSPVSSVPSVVSSYSRRGSSRGSSAGSYSSHISYPISQPISYPVSNSYSIQISRSSYNPNRYTEILNPKPVKYN